MTSPYEITITAIAHLASHATDEDAPLYIYDKHDIGRLAATHPWTKDDQRQALLLFAKYRKLLIRDGFDYHTVFPRNKYNAGYEERVKKIYEMMDYLIKTHNIKAPHGYDLMPLEVAEKWVRDKIVEVRIMNANRGSNRNTISK